RFDYQSGQGAGHDVPARGNSVEISRLLSLITSAKTKPNQQLRSGPVPLAAQLDVVLQHRHLAGPEPQPQLAATPQHVFGARCPFMLDEIAHFQRMKASAEVPTHAVQAAAVPEQFMGQGTVAAGETSGDALRQPWIELLQVCQ